MGEDDKIKDLPVLKNFAQMWYHIGISYFVGHPPTDTFEMAWKQFREDFEIDSNLKERFKKIMDKK